MIPISPTRERGRCRGTPLTLAVFCAVVSIASCATYQLQQTPAQDRGGFFDGLTSLNPFAAAPAPPAYNIPDVAGFGMYPLWKFHKFDGLSLRPVPYGVDIGSGIPPAPSPPNYPVNFLSSPSPAGNGPPMKNSYNPPASPPATNYESSPPSNPPVPYSGAPAAPSYAPSASPSYGAQQNPQILNYVPNGPPSYPAAEAPAASYGAQSQQSPMTLSYQPASPSYNAPAAQSYNPQPAATSYGEPQGYSAPQAQSYGSQPSYPDGTGMGGITIQFSAPASPEYGMQPQPSYGSAPSGSYQMPSSYGAIENPMTVSYQPEAQPMDPYSSSGGYYKRSSNEANKKMGTVESEGVISSDSSFSQ